MHVNNHTKYLLPLCMLAASTTSLAIDLSVAAELMYFDYEETEDGISLNHETGFIPGVSIAASRPYRSIEHSLEFSAYGGEVDHDGNTQQLQPHQTTTEQRIYRLLYKLSWSLQNTDADLYGKVYWQQWDRDIQPNNRVLGLFERYQWWSIEAGTEVPLMRKDRQDLLLGLGILTTLNGTIMIDLSDFGTGEPVLELGDGIGFFGELKYEIKQNNNSRFKFGLQLRTWEFGRSNTLIVPNGFALCGQPTCEIHEPESTTIQTTLSASYIHHF